jgi:uncharacterized membrane protein
MKQQHKQRIITILIGIAVATAIIAMGLIEDAVWNGGEM